MKPIDLPCCVTLSKLVNFSMPQTPHLENGDSRSAFLTELLKGLNEVTCTKFLEQCLSGLNKGS